MATLDHAIINELNGKLLAINGHANDGSTVPPILSNDDASTNNDRLPIKSSNYVW